MFHFIAVEEKLYSTISLPIGSFAEYKIHVFLKKMFYFIALYQFAFWETYLCLRSLDTQTSVCLCGREELQRITFLR